MRRILLVIATLLVATMIVPASHTLAAPRFSCQFQPDDATSQVSVSFDSGKTTIDAVWMAQANCPKHPLVDGQQVRFHETTVLQKVGLGKVAGTTRIVVDMPSSLPIVFNGLAYGSFDVNSSLLTQYTYATVSHSSSGLNMLDPHQFIVFGPLGQVLSFSAGGLPTTITS
ncbi:MAG TPA: hypothetical protein VFY10_15155 [Dehalococcoidia bacterium]|nr:hypothetical protein [Dehalococcoidia bacterium]